MKERVKRLVGELRRRRVIGTAGAYMVFAFIAMQVVDAFFPHMPLPENAGTIVLVLLVVGFPISIMLSWTLELTAQGWRKELTAEEASSPLAGAAVLQPKKLRQDSIAVLPFVNLSANPENEYFSDGITDDIIASVARIHGLRVLSRTSVMQYKGVLGHIGEIAGELGVATVVTGSVRRSGPRVRIVAEVVDAASDDHLWSETYDRDLEDIFRIQSEVAAHVADAVQRELSPADLRGIESRGTIDPKAYDLYLRGRHLWNQRHESAVGESLGFFERALERDPDFALAHAGLADANTVLGIYGARAPGEAMPRAKAAAERALQLEPSLGQAMTARACVTGAYDWAWEEAEAGYREAIGASPSYATAHQWFALNLLAPLKRFRDASEELDRASGLDPQSSAIAVSRGILAFYAGDYGRAAKELESIARVHPRLPLAHHFLGQCRGVMGDLDGALESLGRAVDLSEESSEMLAALGHALARAERAEDARAISDRLMKRAGKRYVSPALLAQIALGLDEPGPALDYLDAAARLRAADLIWIGVRPVYNPLRDSDRFGEIMRTVGVA